MTNNLYGAIFMSASVLGYIINDTIIKYFAANLPIFQIIFIRGIFVSVLIGLICLKQSAFKVSLKKKDVPFVTIRSIVDLLATIFFLTALFNMPLANANAILQTLPLTVTLLGSIIFKEKFGIYRSTAILIGFVGVLLIIRPGTDGFNYYSIFAVGAVFFITLRELTTRKISRESSTLVITFITALAITISGAVGLVYSANWVVTSLATFCALGAASMFIFIAYFFSIPAMQYGEISFVSPFRFTLMFWAVLFGYIVFNEIPDIITVLGVLMIVASGIFTIYRENKKKTL